MKTCLDGATPGRPSRKQRERMAPQHCISSTTKFVRRDALPIIQFPDRRSTSRHPFRRHYFFPFPFTVVAALFLLLANLLAHIQLRKLDAPRNLLSNVFVGYSVPTNFTYKLGIAINR